MNFIPTFYLNTIYCSNRMEWEFLYWVDYSTTFLTKILWVALYTHSSWFSYLTSWTIWHCIYKIRKDSIFLITLMLFCLKAWVTVNFMAVSTHARGYGCSGCFIWSFCTVNILTVHGSPSGLGGEIKVKILIVHNI